MLHRGKVSGILRCWAEAGNVLELGFSLSPQKVSLNNLPFSTVRSCLPMIAWMSRLLKS